MDNSKTIFEWINSISDPNIKSLALQYECQYWHTQSALTDDTALRLAFSWHYSKEGYPFWKEIYNDLGLGKQTKPFEEYKYLISLKCCAQIKCVDKQAIEAGVICGYRSEGENCHICESSLIAPSPFDNKIELHELTLEYFQKRRTEIISDMLEHPLENMEVPLLNTTKCYDQLDILYKELLAENQYLRLKFKQLNSKNK